MNRTKLAALLVVLVTLVLLFVKSDTVEVSARPLGENATILAFGDSLTYGYGAVDQAYPLQLEQMTGRRVINAGVSGEVSAEGLRRLPGLLEQYHPQLVILCHGGNDILRRLSKERLKENLLKMVALSQAAGAEVLLVGVPGFGLLGLSTLPLYKEIAESEHLLYEGSVLEKIENDPVLKSDQIHPNGAGYRLMAEAFARVLREHGLI